MPENETPSELTEANPATLKPGEHVLVECRKGGTGATYPGRVMFASGGKVVVHLKFNNDEERKFAQVTSVEFPALEPERWRMFQAPPRVEPTQ
jgi:hypothetical protein